MDVKEAVKIALQYVDDLFKAEKLSHLGLEEVVFNDFDKTWDVTVGFSRPWDYPRPNIFSGMGMQEPAPRRQYWLIQTSH